MISIKKVPGSYPAQGAKAITTCVFAVENASVNASLSQLKGKHQSNIKITKQEEKKIKNGIHKDSWDCF